MREIKFRAWDLTGGHGRMVAWEELQDASVRIAFIKAPREVILMQYTGLKDKNGREIYEGDILRHPKVGDVGSVEWDDLEEGTPGFHWLHPKMYACPMTECEVIGNIYENPELVK